MYFKNAENSEANFRSKFHLNSTVCLLSIRHNSTSVSPPPPGYFGTVAGIAEHPTDCSGKVQ